MSERRVAMQMDTTIAHPGIDPASHGFVNPPVYGGPTAVFPDVETMSRGGQRYPYGR